MSGQHAPLNQAAIDHALAASRTPEKYRVPVKVYFHNHNGAMFHFYWLLEDGKTPHTKSVMFVNYKYVTDDSREQEQLDAIADRPGTFVYTMRNSEVEQHMAQERALQQAEQIQGAARSAVETTGRQFDPSVPVVPVSMAPGHAPQGMAVVGMQNSMSGTAGVTPLAVQPTTPQQQTMPPQPTAANAEALARIAAMAEKK